MSTCSAGEYFIDSFIVDYSASMLIDMIDADNGLVSGIF